MLKKLLYGILIVTTGILLAYFIQPMKKGAGSNPGVQ
jgi:hypothetical protein